MTPEAGEDQLRLPRPPGVLRRFLARRPVVTDVAVVIVALLLGWFEVDRVGLEGTAWEVLGGPWLVVNLVTAAALLLRRSHPAVPFVLAAASSPLVLLDDRGPLMAPFVVTVYAFAVYRSTRAAVVAAAIAAVLAVGLGWIAFGAGREPLLMPVGVVIAVLLGTNIGNRRRYIAAVLDRAAQLVTERDQRARLAVAAERGRIARELHDVVAHGLSVIVRLSDGAEAVVEVDPGRSRAAVKQIGRVGRDSLRDMRRLLGVLSDDDTEPDLAPQPSLADLDPLVETYRAAGLPVVLERSGKAELGPATQLVVYRAVQEGLTNALRYALSPRRVLVALRFGAVVEVEVTDDGAGGAAALSIGSGRGLIGLRERAALYGGEVQAGRRADLDGAGWRLLVRLPLPPDGTEGGA